MDASGHIFTPEEVERMHEQRKKLLVYFPAEDVDDVKALGSKMRKALYKGLRHEARRKAKRKAARAARRDQRR